MADVKIRKLDDWVLQSFRSRARRAGHSLEEELRQTLTDLAKGRERALIDEIDAFREGLRVKYGVQPDSTPLIRELRDEDIG